MPDVSAALVMLTGGVFTVAGVLPSPLTDASRQKLVGLGYLITAIGFMAWAFAFIAALVRH